MNKKTFLKALEQYDSTFAKTHEIIGILTKATLHSKRAVTTNILENIAGVIIGIVTGHGFYRISTPEKGCAVLTKDGIFFFAEETVKKTSAIVYHIYFPIADISKVMFGRNIILMNQLVITGKYEDESNGRKQSYRIVIPRHRKNRNTIETFKEKLAEENVRIKKNKGGFVFSFMFLALVSVLLFGIFMPRWTKAYRTMDYAIFRNEINNPNRSQGSRYQDRTTTFTAQIATQPFMLTLENGTQAQFLGAVIAGNERKFLVEVQDSQGALPAVGDVVRIRAIGRGAIATRPQEPPDFFTRLGIHMGDIRITGATVQGGTEVLSHSYYLYMYGLSFEAVTMEAAVESDTFTAASGSHRITFVEAFHASSGGARAAEVIIIHFDYEAFTAHNAGFPITRNFTVYQGEEALTYWDGGLRADSERNFMGQNSLEAGEIFYGRIAVVPHNTTDNIRIVRYGEAFQIIFTWEMPVG
jgi:hypothetical protein